MRIEFAVFLPDPGTYAYSRPVVRAGRSAVRCHRQAFIYGVITLSGQVVTKIVDREVATQQGAMNNAGIAQVHEAQLQLQYQRQLAQAACDATQVTRRKARCEAEVFDTRDEGLDRDAQIEPRKMQAETTMGAGGKAQVAVWRARDIGRAGTVEHARIAIRAAEVVDDVVALLAIVWSAQLGAGNVDIAHDAPTIVRRRHVDA